MNVQGHFHGTLLGLNLNARRIKDRTGVTHPGTKQCAVCRRLMLRMVPGMFRRLGLRQSADRKNTEYKSD